MQKTNIGNAVTFCSTNWDAGTCSYGRYNLKAAHQHDKRSRPAPLSVSSKHQSLFTERILWIFFSFS